MSLRQFKNLARMAVGPLRERGLAETLRSAAGCLGALGRERREGFDRRHGTDTDRHLTWSELGASGPDVPPLWRYFPTLAAPFRRMLDAIDLRWRDFTFVDLGSGKGRVLLLAAERPFRRVVGVELSPALHRVAQHNLACYRSPAQRCFRFELHCRDAASYRPPSEDTLVYLFQPFPEPTLSAVVENLRASLRRRQHRILIAYMNPIFRRSIERGGEFVAYAGGAPEGPGEFAWTLFRSRS
jgi:SAM-dependent methyltransferase